MNKKSIFISVFEMAEKGELTSTEQSQVMNALITYGCGLKPEEVSQVFKNIRLGTRHLLEQTEKSLDFALDSVNELCNFPLPKKTSYELSTVLYQEILFANNSPLYAGTL